ncbi:MAG TPA: hypothetical protein VMW15_08410 [Terracidiphilus sp.]|nr:hypothetical protein [Terracidiphilus sp.]
MVAILKEDEVVGVFHQRLEMGWNGFGCRASPQAFGVLQKQFENRCFVGHGRYSAVLPPDAANPPVGMTKADIECAGVIFYLRRKQAGGDIGIVRMNSVFEVHSRREKIFGAEAKQWPDAIVNRKHRQVLMERELKLGLNQEPGPTLLISVCNWCTRR